MARLWLYLIPAGAVALLSPVVRAGMGPDAPVRFQDGDWRVILVLLTAAAVLVLPELYRLSPWHNGLRRAITRGQIVPWYQPVVCGERGVTGGAEVLARRRMPDGSVVLPGAFMAEVVRRGLMVRMMCRLMQQVAADMLATPLPPGFRLSVNADATCLGDPAFARECLTLHRVLVRQQASLTLEITEQACLTLTPALLALLGTLRDEGVTVALDDFGTGWSGPLLLAALPVDYVKLDAVFTRGAGLPLPRVGDDEDRYLRMAERLITLVHDTGVVVVAEGIETHRQRLWLLARGVTWHQGWLYARPMPAADFDAWMATCVAHMPLRPLAHPATLPADPEGNLHERNAKQ